VSNLRAEGQSKVLRSHAATESFLATDPEAAETLFTIAELLALARDDDDPRP
jgi:hypothetical protein